MLLPYIGQIQAYAFNFAPRGWLACNGQLLPISQYQALFAILGTTYGGDGVRNFQLPDLRSRIALGANPNNANGLSQRTPGSVGGAEYATLTVQQVPAHTHMVATSEGEGGGPTGLLTAPGNPGTNVTTSPTGNGTPLMTLPPTLAVNWCIAVQGLFPTRS